MHTENVTLRPFLTNDRARILDILTSQSVSKTYMLPEFVCREDAIPLFERLVDLSRDESRYVRCIVLGNTAIGYLNDVEVKDGQIELGFAIHPDSQGNGYMTTALKIAIRDLLSSGYESVICGAFEHNAASLRVMDKCGMKRIPYTNSVEYKGVTYRCRYYAATKENIKTKYRCLVLDHDDTVVQTEKTLGYPFFCKVLNAFRPGETISFDDYVLDCHNYGFAEMCRLRWNFTPEEQKEEYRGWMEYLMTQIPDTFPGIGDVIRRQKEAGGLICVVSHSSTENITRDYSHHFGILPDTIYGWDLPKEQRKPNSYPLLDIMAKYELSPSDILVVDDMKLGWKMANSINVPIAFAAWGKLDFPELSDEMTGLCDYHFESPAEFAKFLFY